MLWIKIIALLLVMGMTVLAAVYPFFKKITSKTTLDYPYAETFALGVFLGAGLLHMLPDAAVSFAEQQFDYPIAYLLTGATFLLLLLIEHVGIEVYSDQATAGEAPKFAYLATLMLSIHAILAGTALGLSDSYTMIISITIAILAHKWAESFALAICINKSSLSTRSGLLLYAFFATMVPLGILLGDVIEQQVEQYPLYEAVFSSLAAGTFIYLGTLHGLKTNLANKCCNLRRFSAVLLGFAMMAVVAIWV